MASTGNQHFVLIFVLHIIVFSKLVLELQFLFPLFISAMHQLDVNYSNTDKTLILNNEKLNLI